MVSPIPGSTGGDQSPPRVLLLPLLLLLLLTTPDGDEVAEAEEEEEEEEEEEDDEEETCTTFPVTGSSRPAMANNTCSALSPSNPSRALRRSKWPTATCINTFPIAFFIQ